MSKMKKILGNVKKGSVFVLSAPAGSGKTTLIRKLVKEFDSVVESVSFTTRPIRKGEIEGVDYCFISQDEFKKRIKQDEFLEYAKVYDYYYGTSKKWVEKRLNKGKHVVLVIDTQGAKQIRKKISASFIFIMPPSINELKKRLHLRKTDSSKSIKERVAWATKEIKEAKNYDYVIVNDDISIAYQVFKSILIAEEHKGEIWK